ncbi:MAG: hypothetical protein JWP37_2296 [Mucilaginibacter sp.]|nr:hypothetical protein [Mucilaginibacter sp.]
MISGFKDVVNKLGQPNRINKLAEGVNGSFYNKKFQYCYFKGLAFEKYNDTLVFGEINFKESPGFYLLNGKYRFDRNTRAADFKRLFPNAFENNELSGTDMNKYHWISLPVSLKRSDDDWAFLFDRNTEKLLKIEHDDK